MHENIVQEEFISNIESTIFENNDKRNVTNADDFKNGNFEDDIDKSDGIPILENADCLESTTIDRVDETFQCFQTFSNTINKMNKSELNVDDIEKGRFKEVKDTSDDIATLKNLINYHVTIVYINADCNQK